MTRPSPNTSPVGGGADYNDNRPPPVQDIRPENANFITIHATGSTPLASLNPFLIRKVIDSWAGEVEQVKKLASGDLLVKVMDSSQVRKLLKLQKFHCYDVTVTIPVSLNTCRGVIFCRDLLNLDEAEIVDGLGDEDVVAARFITKVIDGTRVKTPLVVLTFGKSSIPEFVRCGYQICKVRPFIPNPLRCFKCQKFGHSERTCRSAQPLCGKCAEEGHSGDSCMSLVLRCVNCGGNHSSFSKECPQWKLEREICTVKATEGISFIEARKKVMLLHATPKPNVSYASVMKGTPKMCSAETQTEPIHTSRPACSTLNDSDSDSPSYSQALSKPTPPPVAQNNTSSLVRLTKNPPKKLDAQTTSRPGLRFTPRASSMDDLSTCQSRDRSPGSSPSKKKKKTKASGKDTGCTGQVRLS